MHSNLVDIFNDINRLRYIYDSVNDISIIVVCISSYLALVVLQSYY